MTDHLLDSDTVIHLLRGTPACVSFVKGLQSQGDLLCTSDVVVAEVFSGQHPEHRAIARRLLGSFVFLPTSPEAAELAGEWRCRYWRQGIQIATTDALIAATAFMHQADVVTRNVRDYPMPEISIVPVSLPRPGRS